MRGFLRGSQAVAVFLGVHKKQRIGGYQALIELFELAFVEQHSQACARVQASVVAALGAHLKIVLQRLAPHNLAALLAFEPQALGAYTLFTVVAFHRRLISSKPSHLTSV